jgi:hypothetical protein
MSDMKAKIAAIDDLIDVCEDAIARPGKQKRMAKKETESPKADEKAAAKDLISDMDASDLMKLYEKLG